MLLSDTDGEDQVDQREILLSGFDDHDTHHVISAFALTPVGHLHGRGHVSAQYIETAYGPVREFQRRFLSLRSQTTPPGTHRQLSISNLGTAVDGQGRFLYRHLRPQHSDG